MNFRSTHNGDGEGRSLAGDVVPFPSPARRAGQTVNSAIPGVPAAASAGDQEDAGVSSASASSFVQRLPFAEELAMQKNSSASVGRSRLFLGFECSEMRPDATITDTRDPLASDITNGDALFAQRVVEADALVVLALPWRGRAEIIRTVVESVTVDVVDDARQTCVLDAVMKRVHETMHGVVSLSEHQSLQEVSSRPELLHDMPGDAARVLPVHQRH